MPSPFDDPARPQGDARRKVELQRRIEELEAALRDSQSKYRGLFDGMANGYARCEMIRDPQGRAIDFRYLELNPAFALSTGIPVAEAEGRKVSEVISGMSWWIETFDRIVKAGVPDRVEYEVASLGRWYEVFTVPTGADQFTAACEDITARKQTELALRENEERQAFLLRLSDALQPLGEAADVQVIAVAMTGEALRVDRCYYAEIDRLGQVVGVNQDYLGSAPYSLVGRRPLPPFETLVNLGGGNEPVICEDIAAHPALASGADAYRERGVRAFVVTPLVKRGVTVAFMCVTMEEPRRWTGGEVELLAQVAERTWAAVERARAEAALRESEERFSQFAKASSAGIWIRDAATLAMEYVSPAIGAIYGVEPDAVIGDVEKWAAMVLPEDRDVALEHIARARQGESVVHEFRIQRPSDMVFRWIRNTDFPLHDDRHVQRIGGIAEDVTEEKLSIEHQGVLLAELQHRVRNIMAILRSIAVRTGGRAESVPEYAELLAGRILALARVQALLTRAANVSVDIGDIVRNEVSAQAHHEGQYDLIGPRIALSPKAAEVLTLAVHELATNALKYGALSAPDGKVTVRWEAVERRGVPWLTFDWAEEGAPPDRPPPGAREPRRRGFGSELIEARIPYELRGKGQIAVEPGGAHCHLEFPLRDGASILETGAPQRATVFGGALDMTGEPDLSGQSILVVEDEYYLATDAARALRGAGAEVIGPYPTEEAARVAFDERRPNAALLDINLGPGPSFKLAETLKVRGVPFLFLTGYDQAAIPEEFDGIERLQKPVQLRQIVGAVSNLLTSASEA